MLKKGESIPTRLTQCGQAVPFGVRPDIEQLLALSFDETADTLEQRVGLLLPTHTRRTQLFRQR